MEVNVRTWRTSFGGAGLRESCSTTYGRSHVPCDRGQATGLDAKPHGEGSERSLADGRFGTSAARPIHRAHASAKFLGEPDENSFGPPDVAQPIRVFVLDQLTYELRAAFAEPG